MNSRIKFIVIALLDLAVTVIALRCSSNFISGKKFHAHQLHSSTVESDYDAQAITVLEGLEPVRKRPGMYIGSTGQRGLNHLVFEVVDNSVDEALAGHCSHISVTLHNGGSVEVADNGRGIPCSLHPTTGKSALETVLCVLHAGGKFGGEDSGYKVSGGLHGVGLSVVNALSEDLKVEVVREKKVHKMAFSKGVPQTALIVTPADATATKGTKVWFKPDPTIFKTTTEFEFDKLASRMDELAYLNAGLTLTLTDTRSKASRATSAAHTSSLNDDDDEYGRKDASPALLDVGSALKGLKNKKKSLLNDATDTLAPPTQVDAEAAATATSLTTDHSIREEVYRHDGGIKELVGIMCAEKIILHPEVEVITIKDEKKGVTAEVAMRWSKVRDVMVAGCYSS